MGRRILCLGDSNTYGYDPRSYVGGRYPETVRWTGQLRLSGLDVVNFGQNGLSIPMREQDYSRFRDLILRNLPANLVTVMLGSNDLLQSSNPDAEAVGRRMEDFLRSVMVPGVRFLLIAPPPMIPGTWVQDKRLLTESTRLAKRYLDTAETLSIAYTDSGAWNVGLTFDGVHFSPEGHTSFAAGLGDALDGQWAEG